MRKKRFIVLTLVFLLTLCIVDAQQSNPFDIINRNAETNIPLVPPQVIVESDQEVDVHTDQNNEDVVNNISEPDTIISDVNPSVIDLVEEPKTSFLDAQQQKLMQQNPFNVTHIPLKRSTKAVKQPIKVEKEVADKVESQEIEALPPSSKEVSNEIPTNKFIFWLLLLQLLLISSLLGINREIIRKIYRSISNDNFAKLVSRDYNGGYNALFVILYILFFLSLSIFIYLVFRSFYGINGFAKYLLVLMSVIGIYAFRHVFQGVTGYVFPFGKTSSYFNFMIILFNSFLGLILIPINIIVAYAPNGIATFGIYLGIGSFVVLYLLRFLRGTLHAYTYVRNYLFHFFLYLCTCEFAPIFILVKFLSKSFVN